MKKIIFCLWAAILIGYSAKGQDSNVLSGLGYPAYGVRIKANFPYGNGGWARGYYVVNQDNSSIFFGLGAMGSINNGISAMDYGWIGQDYNNSFMSFLPDGNVGIGTNTPKEKLSVNGKIRAQEIKVETANWPDYVFDQDYKILGLAELENYIKANKHLPDMPSAKEAEANGVALGEMVKLQQKKIEELTLHLIEKDKQLIKEQYINQQQQERLKRIEEKLKIK